MKSIGDTKFKKQNKQRKHIKTKKTSFPKNQPKTQTQKNP